MILNEGTWHIPIIRAAVAAVAGVYVEIGVRDGTCFNEVAGVASEAHAVDIIDCAKCIAGGKFWHTTTDGFFEVFDGTADVVFIDADHSREQAARDFENALSILAPDGTVFLHDTWPVNAQTLLDTGTVWELAAELEQGPMNVFTYRRYPGLTVVQRPRVGRF